MATWLKTKGYNSVNNHSIKTFPAQIVQNKPCGVPSSTSQGFWKWSGDKIVSTGGRTDGTQSELKSLEYKKCDL